MNTEPIDLFVSIDDEVEMDDETDAAVQVGIEDADAGRVVTLDEVRERMAQWLSKSSLPKAL